MQHLIDGVLNVSSRVVRNAQLHARRQLLLNGGKLFAYLFDDVQRIGGGKNPDTHEGSGFAIEADILIVVFGAQLDVSDFAQANHHTVFLLDDHLLEIFRRAQVGVGDQVHGNHGALGAAERRQIVVLGKHIAHVGGRDAAGRHLVGLEPDTHGKRAIAQNVGALHAADRAQPGLHHAREVVSNLIFVEVLGRKANVHCGKFLVCRLQIDYRYLRLRRQVVLHLVDLGLNLGQGRVGIVVQLQVDNNRAQALRAVRLHVVDSVGAGDHTLQGRGDETAHQVGIGSHIHGCDLDDGNVAARVLPHAQRAHSLETSNQNDEVHHHRQNRTLNE